MIGSALRRRDFGATHSALVAVLLTTACAAGGVTESVSAPTDATSASDQASLVPSAASGAPASVAPSTGAPSVPSVIDLPDHFPVDVPNGGQVEGVYPPVAGTLASEWVVRVLYPAGSEETIVAFYDAWFEAEAIEVEFVTTTPGGNTLHRWTEASADHPLIFITLNVADIYYGGADRLEVWYRGDDD